MPLVLRSDDKNHSATYLHINVKKISLNATAQLLLPSAYMKLTSFLSDARIDAYCGSKHRHKLKSIE